MSICDSDRFDVSLHPKHEFVFQSRPRRFGKSLLMSTLEAYFKGEKSLFKGLSIENLEKDWIRYPVFLIGANFSTETRTLTNWIITKR